MDLDALKIAQGLARAHGHTWGGVDLARLTEFTPESISRACRDQDLVTVLIGREEFMPGITCPQIDPEYGGIVHTTGSGRLTWEVYPESLLLTWSRPTGDYCRASLTWDEGYLAPNLIVEAIDHGAIFARHVEYVVTDLLLALRVWEEVMLDPLLQGSHGEEWVGEVYAALDPLRVDEAAYLLREADWVEEEARRMRSAAADLMAPPVMVETAVEEAPCVH